MLKLQQMLQKPTSNVTTSNVTKNITNVTKNFLHFFSQMILSHFHNEYNFLYCIITHSFPVFLQLYNSKNFRRKVTVNNK